MIVPLDSFDGVLQHNPVVFSVGGDVSPAVPAWLVPSHARHAPHMRAADLTPLSLLLQQGLHGCCSRGLCRPGGLDGGCASASDARSVGGSPTGVALHLAVESTRRAHHQRLLYGTTCSCRPVSVCLPSDDHQLTRWIGNMVSNEPHGCLATWCCLECLLVGTWRACSYVHQ